MNEKDVVLKTGRHIKIKLPPLNLEFMQQMQRQMVQVALVDSKLISKMTLAELQELFFIVSDLNSQYWVEMAGVAQSSQKGSYVF